MAIPQSLSFFPVVGIGIDAGAESVCPEESDRDLRRKATRRNSLDADSKVMPVLSFIMPIRNNRNGLVNIVLGVGTTFGSFLESIPNERGQ